jgi:hypothetical protein
MQRAFVWGALLLVPFLLGASSPTFLGTAQLGIQQFIQGTDAAETYKTLYTAPAGGTRCMSIVATSEDEVDHVVRLRITRAAVNTILAAVPVLAGAGVDGTVAQADLLSVALTPGLPDDSDGNQWIHLEESDVLAVTYLTAFGASGTAETINVFAYCADFQ